VLFSSPDFAVLAAAVTGARAIAPESTVAAPTAPIVRIAFRTTSAVPLVFIAMTASTRSHRLTFNCRLLIAFFASRVTRSTKLELVVTLADPAKRGGACLRCHLSHPSSSAPRATHRGFGWFTSADFRPN
jgi:hypothetical protein